MNTGITVEVELDIMELATLIGALECRRDKLDPAVDIDDLGHIGSLYDKLYALGGFGEFEKH